MGMSMEGFFDGADVVAKAMKTKVSNYNEDSDGGEQEAEDMGMCLSSLVNLLFLFFLSFPGVSL